MTDKKERIISKISIDDSGKEKKVYFKACLVCDEYFQLKKHLINKRKYCSHKCGATVYGIENGKKGSVQLIKRNKNSEFRKKVSTGLILHFKNNPRNKEAWYIRKYGENYIPKKPKHSNPWKTLSVKLRKNNSCARCNSDKFLDVHHIIPFTISRDSSLNNLVVLCRKCHQLTENNNIHIYNIFKDWEVVRSCYKLNFEDKGKVFKYA